MTTLTMQLPETVFSALHADPKEFTRQMRIAAVWNLGNKESAVFSYAVETPGASALVDDFAARRCAKAFGMLTLGTGALLVLVKQRGLIDLVKECVQLLLDSGLYISDSVVRLLISEAGE